MSGENSCNARTYSFSFSARWEVKAMPRVLKFEFYQVGIGDPVFQDQNAYFFNHWLHFLIAVDCSERFIFSIQGRGNHSGTQ